MGIPNAVDFASWCEAASAPIKIDFDYTLLNSLDREQAIEFFIASETAHDQEWERLCRLKVPRWLASQRGYNDAVDRVLGRKKRSPPLGRAARVTARVDRLFKEPHHHRLLASALVREVEEGFSRNWTVRCARALGEFLEGSAPADILRTLKSLDGEHRKLVDAARSFVALADSMDSFDFRGMRVRVPQALRRVATDIGGFIDPDQMKRLVPIARLDESAKERLFVYRIWQANKAVTGKPRTESIVDLLTLECFKRRYDSRSVERLCSQFSDSYRLSIEHQVPGHLRAKN